MQDFFTFVLQNWPYFLLLLAILAAIAWFETRTTIGGIKKIDTQNLVRLINHDNAVVIDVRDSSAFKVGHIIGSINVPIAQLTEKNKKLQKFKGKPIIVVCVIGQSSLKAAQLLKKQAFESVYSLNGGITAWKNAGLPLEKAK